jgi:hypothetical protein
MSAVGWWKKRRVISEKWKREEEVSGKWEIGDLKEEEMSFVSSKSTIGVHQPVPP